MQWLVTLAAALRPAVLHLVRQVLAISAVQVLLVGALLGALPPAARPLFVSLCSNLPLLAPVLSTSPTPER